MPKVKSLNPQREEISATFRIALAKKGWSQEHLAYLCGLPRSTVSNVMRRPDHCHFFTVISVARALGVREIPVV